MAGPRENYSSTSSITSDRPKSGSSSRHRTDSEGSNKNSPKLERRISITTQISKKISKLTKSFRKKSGEKRTERRTSESDEILYTTLLQSAKDHLRYPQADMDRHFGCGVLVLITMFTGSLKGYRRDYISVKSFFQGLDYDIFEAPMNCNKADLYEFLKTTQSKIQGNEKQYDRLFCIVMSHGLKDGLLTCLDRSGQMEETQSDMSVNGSADVLLTPVDDIVEFFKHDRLPKLKGCPKQFMIQACKGLGVVKAAAGLKRSRTNSDTGIVSAGSSTSSDMSTSAGSAATSVQDCANFMIRPTIPVDGDISICYASTDDNMSFVDDQRGSWFIEAVIDTFKQYMHGCHVADMITIAKNLVSEKRKKFIQDDPDGNEVLTQAVQMPYTNTTFRKQFWLQSSRVENPWLSQQPMACHPSHSSTCPQNLNNLGSPLLKASQSFVSTHTPSPKSFKTDAQFVFPETVHENDTCEERGLETSSATVTKTKPKPKVSLQRRFSEQPSVHLHVHEGCLSVVESVPTLRSSFYPCNKDHCITRCICRRDSHDATPTHYHKLESLRQQNTTVRHLSGSDVADLDEPDTRIAHISNVTCDSGENTPTVDTASERPMFTT